MRGNEKKKMLNLKRKRYIGGRENVERYEEKQANKRRERKRCFKS